MSDDKNKRGIQDRSRISLSEEHEVRYWTKELGVSRDELSEAVKSVGASAAKVREHLQSRGGAGGQGGQGGQGGKGGPGGKGAAQVQRSQTGQGEMESDMDMEDEGGLESGGGRGREGAGEPRGK